MSDTLDTQSKLAMIARGESHELTKLEIEDAIVMMREAQEAIDWYAEVKRNRSAVIDAKIDQKEKELEAVKAAVKNALEREKVKSLDFPGVGKVSARALAGTWKIEDESGLRAEMERLGFAKEVVEESWKFKKKDLNKVLDLLEKNNNVPAGAAREKASTSLSVSYEKPAPAPQPTSTPSPSAPSLDGLNF